MQWQEIQAPTIIKIIPQVHTWGSLSYKKNLWWLRVIFLILLIAQ